MFLNSLKYFVILIWRKETLLMVLKHQHWRTTDLKEPWQAVDPGVWTFKPSENKCSKPALETPTLTEVSGLVARRFAGSGRLRETDWALQHLRIITAIHLHVFIHYFFSNALKHSFPSLAKNVSVKFFFISIWSSRQHVREAEMWRSESAGSVVKGRTQRCERSISGAAAAVTRN